MGWKHIEIKYITIDKTRLTCRNYSHHQVQGTSNCCSQNDESHSSDTCMMLSRCHSPPQMANPAHKAVKYLSVYYCHYLTPTYTRAHTPSHTRAHTHMHAHSHNVPTHTSLSKHWKWAGANSNPSVHFTDRDKMTKSKLAICLLLAMISLLIVSLIQARWWTFAVILLLMSS